MRLIFLALVILASFYGCSAKHNPNGSYERANSASEKALEQLDKE
jgi:hypothetical protein